MKVETKLPRKQRGLIIQARDVEGCGVWKISSTYTVLAPKLSTSAACIPPSSLAHGSWLSGTSITGPVFAVHVNGNLFCAVCACIMWIASLGVT